MARTPSLGRAVRPLAACEPSGSRIRRYRKVWQVLQNLLWLNVLCSVSKVFNACCCGRSPALSRALPTAGLTRRSSGRSTAGRVRLASERPCRRCPPLTSYVRPILGSLKRRKYPNAWYPRLFKVWRKGSKVGPCGRSVDVRLRHVRGVVYKGLDLGGT